MKNILLISYSFPPYPGIGGRRWAKFAKYLKQRGHTIDVISSENPFKTASEWTKDIEGINVHRLPLKYPSALITYPKGLLGMLRYRLSLAKVRTLTSKNYYDRTLFWEKQLVQVAGKLIKEKGIKNVIVSGAPFHLMYHATKLKDLFPGINLIVDFRDYWTEDKSLFHSGSLSAGRILEETKLEKVVLQKADKLIAVAETMTSHFNKVTGTGKCSTIMNGYDEDDFRFLESKIKSVNKKTTFIFTGNLYKNLEDVFLPFCAALGKLKELYPDHYNKVSFEFYGHNQPEYKVAVKEKELDCVFFSNPISLSETHEKIYNADYCMLFLNTAYSFSFSTKFCEYLGLKKKLVLFSKRGITSEFVQKNKLGHWIDPENCFNDLFEILKNADNKAGMGYAPGFDPAAFSIRDLTNKVEALLE